MPPRRTAAPLVAAALVALASRPVGAAPRLEVAVDPCVGVPASAIQRDVGVELDALVVEAREGQSVDTTSAQIGCEGPLVRVVVTDPLSGKTVSRRIDPRRERPEARARLLALSVVELVAASWIELERQPPAAAAVDARGSRAARESAAASAGRVATTGAAVWGLGVGGSARGFSESFASSVGVAISAARSLRRTFLVAGDLALERGEAAVSLGRVGNLLGSTAASLLVQGDLGRLTLAGGLGGRVGLVRLEGRASPAAPEISAASPVRPWAGPFLATRLSLHLTDRIALGGGLETGYVALPVDGTVDGVAELGLRGFWLSGSLGVTLAL